MAVFGVVTTCCVLFCMLSVVVYGQQQPSTVKLWPQPQQLGSLGAALDLDRANFHFAATGAQSEILSSAFERYTRIIFERFEEGGERSTTEASSPLAALTGVDVKVLSSDVTLNSKMNEAYNISIKAPRGLITANQVWGALRGLETFSQLVRESDQGDRRYINQVEIVDYPRFPFRGLMIDTSRHYIPIDTIMFFVDAMAYSKFNVLHWHIVDDQSFPYVSEVYPKLSGMGAYNNRTHIYTTRDIERVVQHARERGIRVIPEFDTPGHTESWGVGYPDLLTPCYTGNQITGRYAINPILSSSYTFMTNIWKEIGAKFPDDYVHLGGDELEFTCWKSNPNITEFMKQQGMTQYSQVEGYYEAKLLQIVKGVGKSYIIWQEVFDNGVDIAQDTVIDVWKGGWQDEMAKVTAKGYTTVLSNPWYINYIGYGATWQNYYKVEPLDFTGTAAQKKLVMGGEGCLWGEFIDASNIMPRAWPFACAIGERLWSAQSQTDINDASDRLHWHRCRLVERGVPAQPPDGPSFCPHEWQPRRF